MLGRTVARHRLGGGGLPLPLPMHPWACPGERRACPSVLAPVPSGALKGKRRPQQRLDRRLEEVAKAVAKGAGTVGYKCH